MRIQLNLKISTISYKRLSLFVLLLVIAAVQLLFKHFSLEEVLKNGIFSSFIKNTLITKNLKTTHLEIKNSNSLAKNEYRGRFYIRNIFKQSSQIKLIQLIAKKEIFKWSQLNCTYVELPWRNRINIERDSEIFAVVKVNETKKGFSKKIYCKIKYLESLQNKKQRLDKFIFEIRNHLKEFIYQKMGESQTANLYLGTSLGFRSEISPFLEQKIKNLGLMHLLVVSGYQVSMVFYLLQWLVKFLLSKSYYLLELNLVKNISSIIAIFGTVVFVAICNFEESAIRALLAVVIIYYASTYGFKINFSLVIFCTAFTLVLFNPLSFESISFQLTFAALLGIATGLKLSDKVFNNNSSRILGTYFIVNFTTSMFTSIITGYYFKQFSLISFYLNPLLAPIISIIGCPVFLLAVLLAKTDLDGGLFLDILNWIGNSTIQFLQKN